MIYVEIMVGKRRQVGIGIGDYIIKHFTFLVLILWVEILLDIAI